MPQNLGITIAGRQMVRPGVVAQTDVEGFNQGRAPLLKRGALLGESLGGPPQQFVTLNPDRAAALLKGGDSLKLLDIAFDPSADVPGVGEVDFYRVNAAEAATLHMGDLILTLISEHAGLLGNGFRAKRELHSGGQALLLTLEDPATGAREESPPLGPALQLTYLGTGAASVTVATTGGVKTLQLTGDSAAENHTFVLGETGLRTIADVEDALNRTSAWSGVVVFDHHAFPADGLPEGTPALVGNEATLDLGVAAQVAWLEGSVLARGEATGGAATNTNAGFLGFSGGTEGPAPTLQDYLQALDALKNRNVQAVMVASSDASVQVAAAAHCALMSHPTVRKERRFFGGPALAANKALGLENAVKLAKEIGSELATIVGTPAVRRNLRTGRLENLSPNETAALVFGMACGVRPEVDLTYKTLRIAGLVWDFDELDEATMIKGGVLPFFFDDEDAVFRVADDVTTWQRDANIMRRLRFGVDVQHYLQRKIRAYTKEFVGGVGDETTVETILNRTETALSEEVRGAQNREGVLTNYGTITASYDGSELVAVEYDASPVGRIGFIKALAHLKPTRIVRQA